MSWLFVDTAGWMAVADRGDPIHADACGERDRWLEQGGRLLTTDYVIDETLTLIRMRLGIPAARVWWEMASRSPRLKVEWINPRRAERAREWFFKWPDQAFSFTDCTSFAVMKEMNVCEALTSDHHFLVAGFTLLPPAA